MPYRRMISGGAALLLFSTLFLGATAQDDEPAQPYALTRINIEGDDKNSAARIVDLIAFGDQVLCSVELQDKPGRQILYQIRGSEAKQVRTKQDSIVIGDIVQPVSEAPHAYVRDGDQRRYFTIQDGVAAPLQFPDDTALGKYGQHFCDEAGRLFWDSKEHALFIVEGVVAKRVEADALSSITALKARSVPDGWLLASPGMETDLQERTWLLDTTGVLKPLSLHGGKKSKLTDVYRVGNQAYVFAGAGSGALYCYLDGKMEPLRVEGEPVDDVSWPSVQVTERALYFACDREGKSNGCWMVGGDGRPQRVVVDSGKPLTTDVRWKSDLAAPKGCAVFESNDGGTDTVWVVRGNLAHEVTWEGSNFNSSGPTIAGENHVWMKHTFYATRDVELMHCDAKGVVKVGKLPNGDYVSTHRPKRGVTSDIQIYGGTRHGFLSCNHNGKRKLYRLPD